MTNTGLAADVPAGFPRHLIAGMRAEVPSLASEIISALRDEFPEYARPMDGPYGQALQIGVHQALSSFLDSIADPAAPLDKRDEVFRTLGKYEAYAGRSLDTLQAAFRVGTRLAWRRVSKVARLGNLSPSAISQLADSVIGYTHELATLSLEGYHEARARSGEARDQWRRRLVALLVETPPVPRRAVDDLAELADWLVPDQITPVAVQAQAVSRAGTPRRAGQADEVTGWAPGTSLALDNLDDDVLADIDSAQPCLLLPGPLTDSRRRMVEAALAGRPAAVGLAVPLESAGDSLRWARHALALSQAGIIPGGPLTLCEQHLVTLLLLSDDALADQVVQRQLARLESLTPRQRGRLTETFAALVEAGGTAVEAADRLHVHPQTVRYRLKQLAQAVGDQLADPDARFELELALRVSRLRQGAAAKASGGSSMRSA
jgi:PucR C-terminal helix-turn-helix domain